MITTIQVHEKLKNELDMLKEGRESYEDVISRLLETLEELKRSDEKLLIRECKEMAKDNLKMTKEWEHIDAELEWEW